MSMPAARRGATLPMVILLITVMTVALAAAYTLNGTESQVGDDYEEQVAALALAESGRHQYLNNAATLVGAPGLTDVDTLAFTGGQAIVTLTRIRPQMQQAPPLYLLTSRGVRANGGSGNIPPAERTVAQYLYWDAVPLNMLAGWTSLSGLNKNGGAGLISGFDTNPDTGSCPEPLPAVAGVAVPTNPGMTGTLTAAQGTPPVRLLGDAGATAGAVDIDWAGMLNGSADIAYDIVIPGQAWPSFADPNYWPTIRINGNYTLSSAGRGTLIVSGTLTQNNGSSWDGIVLVGNTLVSNGNTSVRGATITGLNVLLGQVVPVQDIGNGTKTYQINSCNTARALRNKARLRPLPNTWMDNWASY